MKRFPGRGAWLRGLAWATALLVAAWILSMTLVERGQTGSINLVPFSRKLPALACLLGGCEFPGERNAAAAFLFVDFLGNIAVFVPFGAALAVATFPRRVRGRRGRHFGVRWWGGVPLIGFLLSLGIETAQLFLASRATDIDDVILNTLGTLIGAAFVRLISVFLR
jgi:glycopeptide antibiotics resistance protein